MLRLEGLSGPSLTPNIQTPLRLAVLAELDSLGHHAKRAGRGYLPARKFTNDSIHLEEDKIINESQGYQG